MTEKNEFAAGRVGEALSGTEVNADGIVPVCPEEAFSRRPNVDYGSVTKVTYYSNTCKLERHFSVLLPGDYSEEKTYSVLYLLHGIFGNEDSMTDEANKVRELVAHAVADGTTRDMIVVFPDMFATDDPAVVPAFSQEAVVPYDNFEKELVDDLMPYVEAHYAVGRGRDYTYLAGFSMGGRETIYITLLHPELFGAVCSIAAAPGVVPGKDWAMEHVGSLSEEQVRIPAESSQPEPFIVCCGTDDHTVGAFPKSYHELFLKNGVRHLWYEIPGADHDTNAIRSGIYNLLRQIGRQ